MKIVDIDAWQPKVEALHKELAYAFSYVDYSNVKKIAQNMMVLAFITRGLFVYHRLPNYIKKTSSTVYVDMASKTKI